jgi:dTDP-4-amino-4,6-dideoxygalactose transaminase
VIRLTVPSIEKDDLEVVQEVLTSGYLVQGARVAAFEKAVSEYVGTKYAVAVSSCTAALHLALLSLDVGPDDLVVVTAYSYVATANVIALCGAHPVFVDIRPDTFNLDPNALEDVLKRLMADSTKARRVKAILPVHTFGQQADMPEILNLATHYNLPVVEDAACALGATLHGRQAGTWGIMGCFSFHPRKAITTGEGGIITTNAPVLTRRLRALRNHGQDPQTPSPDFVMPGFNYRITEIQAALGLTQIAKLDRVIAARQRLAAHYSEQLARTPIQPPYVSKGSVPVYQSYVTLLPSRVLGRRDDLIRDLGVQGIETTIGTWHMPLTTFFRSRYGYRLGDFAVTDQVFARALTLPLHERLTQAEQNKVIDCIVRVTS